MNNFCKCARCKHVFQSRDNKKPLLCEKCGSQYWDTPNICDYYE